MIYILAFARSLEKGKRALALSEALLRKEREMSVSDIKILAKLLLAVIGIVILVLRGGDFLTIIALIAFVMSMINSARIDLMTSRRGA